jgi:hypothetical protein
MRPYLPCVLGTSTGHETENRRKPNHNRQIVIQALWKSSHPVTLPTRINSTSEPLPKRLYSAKISRALWLARFSGSPLSCPLGQIFYSLVSVREVMRRANRSLLWRRRITKVLLSPYIAHGPGGTSRNSANFQSHASLLPRPR